MLTALELTGFKSFADRTRLEFPAGVTAVVGPNGSGKSNVVDAIKWVLGSQSPKSLRGAEMTDVIFNGSTSRRPLNAAEVTLEFDNTGGLFPAGGPIAEGEPRVRLTRRVYRSGEGEYLINGAGVRLRDLKTLLAGTGMGGQGGGSYGVIEQGRVDAVLQSSPTDRRALFEEAAGISRFRLKKQEAARRLARVEQNLLRLSDIVDEVEGRLRRVRAQAGKARRHREQADRLKQLRTELGLADWRALSGTLARLEALLREAAERRRTIEERLAQHRSELEDDAAKTEGDHQHDEQERRLHATREAIAALHAGLATESRRHTQAEADLAHSRRALLAAATPPPDAEPVATAPDRAEAERLAAEARRLAERAEAAVGAAEAERQQAGEQLRLLTDQRQAAHRATAQAEARVAALATGVGGAEAALAGLQAAAAEHTQATELASKDHLAARRQADADDRQQRQASEALTGAKAKAAQLREALNGSQRELAHAEARLVSAEHRSEAIEELEDKLEKLAADIRGVLTAGPDAPTVHGMVADLLHVDYDTAPMIEAALGAAAQHLVVDSADQLVGALARGQAELRVRARFQRLDAQHPLAAIDRIDLTSEPGVMGRADTFVDSDARYEPLVRRLLGRTWFVDSLATAARLSTGPGRGLTFVTHGGEVLSADGGIFVGPKNNDDGLITGRQQASGLQEELQQLVETVEAARRRVAELESDAARATEAEHDCFELHTQATAARAASRQALVAIEERVAGLGQQAEERSEALRVAGSRLVQEQQELEGARRRAQASLAAEREIDQTTRRAEEEDREAESRLASASAAATDARVAAAKAEQALESLRAGAERRRQGGDEQRRLREELLRQRQQAEAERRSSELALLRLRGELAERMLVREELSAALAAANALRQRRREADQRQAKQARALGDELARTAAQSQQAEIDATRLRLERQTLADRMREDYGIDLAAVAGGAGDGAADGAIDGAIDGAQAEPIDPSRRDDLQRELDRLRDQVQSVGPVNADALEELDDLEGRFDHLSGQYRDLSSAKASLERLTTRINSDSRELFLATIETVRGHFRELFRRLFGGGEADLVLLDDAGDDVLEAGVEIVAQPPGKELSSISLLSGGEKTMTCVALLLALFRTKPSPFCVLDEVDAALDEANIGRFTSVLTDFLASTQFLVVTHSKKTMTGADTIYGVTMQEPGVSTRVGVRFEDVGEDGQLHVQRSADPPPRAEAA